MSNAAQFVGSIPDNYDAHLGPILFADFAADLAQRAAKAGGRDVLELAAGTGISTKALREALPASTRLVATDLNAPMLDIAKQKVTGDVEWQVADALALPFDDDTFDVVTCQFGVMFFPNKQQGFREVRRVLRPHGTFLFNVWGPLSANPFAETMLEIAVRFFPENPPQFYRTPFGYSDAGVVKADLAVAGLGGSVMERLNARREVRDWTSFARGAVFGNPMIMEIEASGVTTGDEVAEASAQAFRERFGPEPARMPLEALVFTAHSAD